MRYGEASGPRAADLGVLDALNLLVLSYLASAAVSAAVMVVAWRRRSVVGARGLALLMLAVAWCCSQTPSREPHSIGPRRSPGRWSPIRASRARPSYTAVRARLDSPGRVADAPADRALARRAMHLRRHAATNEWHHLLWPTVTLVDAWGVTAVYAHGPWFWVEVIYSYSLVGTGLLALVRAMYRYPAAYSTRMRLSSWPRSRRSQPASCTRRAGRAHPCGPELDLVRHCRRRRRMGHPPRQAAQPRSRGLGDAVGYPRRRRARPGPDRRIAAFNPAATRLLGLGGEAVGQPVDQVLNQFHELALILQGGGGDREVEIETGTRDADRRASSILRSRRRKAAG